MSKTIIFDTATGKRVYRRLGERLRAWIAVKMIALWACEIAGVALIAVAAGMWIMPLGIAIGGVYLILVGSSSE